MNLLWVDINASFSHSNLALPSLDAQLSESLRKKCTWKVVGGTIKTPPDRIILEMGSFNPDFIFATAWLFNLSRLMEILERIHAMRRGAKIILGGPEFLGDNSSFLRSHPEVSAVFKGEAEDVFPIFIGKLTAGFPLDECLSLPGFEYIGKNGEYIRKERVGVKDFLALNPPENSYFFRYDKPFVQLETSRGCFNGCRFCVSGTGNAAVDSLPIETVRARLDNFVMNGVREIRILDRTFNGNPSRACRLLELFSEFHGRLKFHLEIHPAFLTGKILNLIATLPENLLHIEAGLQSLNPQVIDACNRKGVPEKAVSGIGKLLKIGKFAIHTDLIAGLPLYGYKDLLSDVSALIESGVDEIQLELLKLLPGTYFRINAKELGLVYSPLPPYEILCTASASYEEMIKSKVLSKILEFWYNDASWRPVFRKGARMEKDFLEKLTDSLFREEFLETAYSYEGKSILLYKFCKQYFPSILPHVSVGWVSNGLSLKKEPAGALVKWRVGDILQNPCFEPSVRENQYYYMEIDKKRIWFVFNYQTNRVRPVLIKYE